MHAVWASGFCCSQGLQSPFHFQGHFSECARVLSHSGRKLAVLLSYILFKNTLRVKLYVYSYYHTYCFLLYALSYAISYALAVHIMQWHHATSAVLRMDSCTTDCIQL